MAQYHLASLANKSYVIYCTKLLVYEAFYGLLVYEAKSYVFPLKRTHRKRSMYSVVWNWNKSNRSHT